MMKLLFNALMKFAVGFLMLGILLFLPAGTLMFTNAWLFLALLFIPMLLIGAVLFLKAPELLKKRLNGKEKESAQKGVIAVSGIIFVAGYMVAGLDFRFAWSKIPIWVICASSVLFLLSYALYAEVMRENAYLSRNIEIQDGQKVIDSGLYGVVRHPMYMATILMYLAMPLILGSWWSFLIFAFYPFLIVIRIQNEERVLEKGLDGYTEYKKKVRYRIIPFIW